MILTDTIINTAKAKIKPFKLGDGGGLYLLIMPNGSKYFRLDYRLDGKRLTLALGVYPEISLEAARERRDIAKKQIKDGINPKLSTVKILTDTAINTVSTQVNTVKSTYNEQRLEQHNSLELTKKAFSSTIDMFIKDDQQKKQADTVRELERKLQDERQINNNLQCTLGIFRTFIRLTEEQQKMLFTPDSPALNKLKELAKLSVDNGIGGFEDDELVKELERRGFEVSIYKDVSK